MKKSVFSKTLALVLAFILAFSAFSVNVFAADEDADIDMGDDVIIETITDAYVSSANGSDNNAGTEAAPFATLAKALVRVANGGTIHIVDTYTVPTDMSWIDRNVDAVTITGGPLSLASSDLAIGYNVIFKDITISGGKAIYANGNNVTFESGANASAVTVYGGSNTGATLESTNLTINGGSLGTVYGGSSVACTINQVNLTVNGGTVANLFGGSNSANLTGNVTVYINGGAITDSIFGGCYNKYTYKSGWGALGASISWDSTAYVIGKVDVIVGENATINTNSSSGTDKAFFAHSRHKTLSSSEDSSIIFTSQTAYNNNSSKFGTKATNAALGTSNNLCGAGMGTDEASAADNVHIHGITTDDTNDIITEGCTLSSGTEVDPCESTTITLTLNNKTSLVYTGEAITPMEAVVNGTLLLAEPTITYSNNVEPGTATATMSYGGASVSKTFTIEKQTQKAPALVAVPESISGLADGEIYGLTTEMEISTDGATYNAVTDTTAKFAAGTYYVRYAETNYKKASEPKTVVIAAGEKLVVTFIADGNTVATKEVSYGETLTDIPEVPAKVGYDKVAPYWDVTDFSNITSDMTVNAVYTINTYKVTYIADGVTVSELTVNYGDSATAPEIPAKEGYTLVAPYWDGEAVKVTEDITITAVYIKDFSPGDVNDDGAVNLKDLVALAQYVAKWENVKVYTYALDIDGSGSVDLADVNILSKYLAGWNVEISSEPYLG